MWILKFFNSVDRGVRTLRPYRDVVRDESIAAVKVRSSCVDLNPEKGLREWLNFSPRGVLDPPSAVRLYRNVVRDSPVAAVKVPCACDD